MTVHAVSTTGIYCRPTCAARPNPANVSDYASAVAAEAAGFRSCLRCRPDREAHTTPTDAPRAVRTALSLIADGYLDRRTEEALADHVGYSTRQLRRLFLEHVGASPDFVARSRRAHFARTLLEDTDLSIAAISRAAGFGSTRQMSRVVNEIFRRPPSQLRGRPSSTLTCDGGIAVRLTTDTSYPWERFLDHRSARAVPGVEIVSGNRYIRTVEVCGHPGAIDIAPDDRGLVLVAHLPNFDALIDEVHRARRMLGVLDDLSSARRAFANDPTLGSIATREPHLPVFGSWDPFETAIRIIVGQQVSVAGASTLMGRIVDQCGTRLPLPALELTHLFPAPDQLSELDPERLGMPRSRATCIVALADAVASGELDLTQPGEDARAQLLALPGIGPWTADMIQLRIHRDLDAFPSTDLGIVHALDRLAPEISLTDTAQRWAPYRALAAEYLWLSLHDARVETTP